MWERPAGDTSSYFSSWSEIRMCVSIKRNNRSTGNGKKKKRERESWSESKAFMQILKKMIKSKVLQGSHRSPFPKPSELSSCLLPTQAAAFKMQSNRMSDQFRTLYMGNVLTMGDFTCNFNWVKVSMLLRWWHNTLKSINYAEYTQMLCIIHFTYIL